jgi:hypothetical protein
MGLLAIILASIILGAVLAGVICVILGELDAFGFVFIICALIMVVGFTWHGLSSGKVTTEELFWGFNWIGSLFSWIPSFWHWLTNPIGGE